MKKTVNVNIGGIAFILDEDAYLSLKRYLAEIEIRLDGMQDIETRIADIFNETLTSRNQVVDLPLVQRAMAIIGNAQEFGEPRRSLTPDEPTSAPNYRRLYRSRNDQIVGGVCGGIAEYFEIDPTLIRILMALFIIFGIGLIVYIVLWIIIPKAPETRYPNTSNF